MATENTANVPLDEPGDLRRIRQMILAHRGQAGSPAPTLVLVEQLLAELASRRPAVRMHRPTSTGEPREDER